MDVVDAATGPTSKHRRFVLSVLVGGATNKSELTGKGGLDLRCSRSLSRWCKSFNAGCTKTSRRISPSNLRTMADAFRFSHLCTLAS